MTLDIEKLKNKLEQLKNPEARRFNRKTWKPKPEGEKSSIRLLEYPFGDDPFPELWFHYGVGKGPGILCPKKNHGRTCPICEFAISLNDSGAEEDKNLAKRLWPRQRMYAVVVDRADAKLSPKYWGFGITVYQKLLEHLTTPQTLHMLDAVRGIDLTVWAEKKAGKKFPETDLVLDRSDSALSESPEEIKDIVNAIIPIEEVFKPSTTAEIKQRLSDWLDFGDQKVDDDDDKNSETVKEKNKEEPTTEVTNVEDVDAEFERALANS